MTFLTPLGAVAGLAGLLLVPAVVFGRSRVASVRHSLGLAPPERPHGLPRLVAAACAFALLAVAAAQPVVVRRSHSVLRSDVQALFVLDTSRSMAASAAPASPTRLDRAIAAAVRLRASIPEVASGVATLTDRVVPNLLAVPDVSGFDRTVERAIGIASPPPRNSAVRATTYAALGDVASGNYFPRGASRRVVVLLTDGESRPVNAGAIRRALPPGSGYRLLAIRVWHGNEAVWDSDGKREAAYRPDPSGAFTLRGLAAALGGRSFDENRLASASSYLRGVVGHGPTTSTRGTERTRVPLAPYMAALAAVLLLIAVLPIPARRPELGLLR